MNYTLAIDYRILYHQIRSVGALWWTLNKAGRRIHITTKIKIVTEQREAQGGTIVESAQNTHWRPNIEKYVLFFSILTKRLGQTEVLHQLVT